MKTPQKDTKSTKGKSRLSLNKKDKNSSNSIISLFKKQKSRDAVSTTKHSKLIKIDSEQNEDDDDDIQIISMEITADKYFDSKCENKSSYDVKRGTNKESLPKVEKLKLRRSRSSLKQESQSPSTPAASTSCEGNEKSLVQKELSNLDGTKMFVEIDEAKISENSQKENLSNCGDNSDPVLSRKLSLRKRSSAQTCIGKNKTSDTIKTVDQSMSTLQPIEKGRSDKSNRKRSKRMLSRKNPSKKTRNDDHSCVTEEVPLTILQNASEKLKIKDENTKTVIEPKCSKSQTHASVSKPLTENDEAMDSCSSACGDQNKELNEELEKQSSLVSVEITENSQDSLPGTDSEVTRIKTDNDEDNEISAVEGDDSDKSKYRDRTPYYLENFTIILNNVLEDEDNKRLFNEDDMKIVNVFKELPEAAQKLYVRLFSRKLTWHLFHKINYPEIADDLTPVLNELISSHLALSAADLNDLETVLRILPAASLKQVAKSFNINLSQSKTLLVEALLKQSKQNTIGSFFMKKSRGGASIMLDRAKKLMGESFKLLEEPRAVFIRILNLFSLLNYNPDEESTTGNHGQLFQMLLVNMGKLVYPTYTLSKTTSIFRNRDDVLRFSSAMVVEADLLTLIDKGDYSGAHDLYLTSKTDFIKLIEDKEQMEWDHSLPSFLRRYTAREVYVRILSQGVEILQRLKQYTTAVEQLRELLDQSDYCPKHRGHWFDRLALNLDQHLNQPKQSLEVIKEGLGDDGVRVGHRYSLYWRAKKICSAPKSKLKDHLEDIQSVDVMEYPKVTIEGKVLSKTIPGTKFTFVLDSCDSEEGITICRVEELVLDYYRQKEFPEGIHGEGGVVSTLFGLYFWDVIFMDIPDAFHSPFQAHPLDQHSDHFYQARKSHIDNRIAEIENMTEEDLDVVLSEIWEKRYGVLCRRLNWETFNNLEHVQGLVRCLGGSKLSGLLGRYARDPRNTRSGFPDLTLWNPMEKTFKFCEVKGPGDRLSHNQIMWLDHLMRLGVDAEVCHVKAVTGKKLSRN